MGDWRPKAADWDPIVGFTRGDIMGDRVPVPGRCGCNQWGRCLYHRRVTSPKERRRQQRVAFNRDAPFASLVELIERVTKGTG